MSELTIDHLSRIMPNCSPAKLQNYFPFIQQAMQEFDITRYLREAAFLAQLAHESGELRYMEEIASGEAYEGRAKLGNTQPGDGKRFKGRGPIQLTGRANYEEFGKLLGVDLITNPQLAATPEIGFRIAGLYWKRKGLNALADQQDFKEITKRINGGYNGLEDRVKYYERAKKVLSPVDSNKTAPAYPGSVLKVGSSGDSVRAMQERLKALGHALGTDGKFGPGTKAAVVAFQTSKGLTADGIVGPGTWKSLFE